MNHQSLINEAPKLVAFGLRTGLLSIKPAEAPMLLDKYRDQQNASQRRCMKALRASRAAESKVSAIES